MGKLLSYSQKDAISLVYFGSRGLTEEMFVEGVRQFAGVADSDAELDLGQLKRDIIRMLNVLPYARVCDQAFTVQVKVQTFLHDWKLSAVFTPNGRWAKGPGATLARAIIAGLTPLGFRDDVRRHVQFQDASGDPHKVVQLMEEMSRTKWAAIDGYQRGAPSSGRNAWKLPSGDRRRSSPQGEAHGLGASGRPIGEGCWGYGSTENGLGRRVIVVREGFVRRVALLGQL